MKGEERAALIAVGGGLGLTGLAAYLFAPKVVVPPVVPPVVPEVPPAPPEVPAPELPPVITEVPSISKVEITTPLTVEQGATVSVKFEWVAPVSGNYAMGCWLGKVTGAMSLDLKPVYQIQSGVLLGYVPKEFEPYSSNMFLIGTRAAGVHTDTFYVTVPTDIFPGNYRVLVTLGYWMNLASNIFTPNAVMLAPGSIVVQEIFPVILDYPVAETKSVFGGERHYSLHQEVGIPNLGPTYSDICQINLKVGVRRTVVGSSTFDVKNKITLPGNKVFENQFGDITLTSTPYAVTAYWMGYPFVFSRPDNILIPGTQGLSPGQTITWPVVPYIGTKIYLVESLPVGKYTLEVSTIFKGVVRETKTVHFTIFAV